MENDKEERIKRRAYEIWDREGRPEGKEAEHWERAAREIEEEDAGKGGAAGLSSGLQGGGTNPGESPATTEGSIGTGGATKRRGTGTAKRPKKPI